MVTGHPKHDADRSLPPTVKCTDRPNKKDHAYGSQTKNANGGSLENALSFNMRQLNALNVSNETTPNNSMAMIYKGAPLDDAPYLAVIMHELQSIRFFCFPNGRESSKTYLKLYPYIPLGAMVLGLIVVLGDLPRVLL